MDGQTTPAEQPVETAESEPDGSSRTSGEAGRGLDKLVGKARRWLVKAAQTPEKQSVAEKLDALLRDDAAHDAPLSRSERMLLANVMRLRDTRVEHVMVVRADIVALERGASLDETLEAFREGSHSRLPVYRETLDDPIGVVHLKDVALSHGFGPRVNDFNLSAHVREVMVVPPSMRVHALLERMQATRRHMALVVDEYGGVDGLVTIEDLIEQIVGDIEDEHDGADGPSWIEMNGGVFLVEARAEIPDFEKAAGVSLLPTDWSEEVDTLGGLVFMLSGRIPARGEVIQHPKGHEFEVVDADPRRIKRLRVRISATEAPLADAAE
ncbi:MAG: hemolysin family protein [Neomegalonema sp.]|nr:hemolysin family protein [Neomegalonema sp.]